MIEISKKTIFSVLIIVLGFIIVFFCGFIRGCVHGRGSVIDEATLDFNESIITDVADVASNFQQGINRAEEQVNTARTEIEQGITSIGEIRLSTDRITTEQEQFESNITEIYRRISAITEIIDKASKRSEVLESNGWG